MTFCIFITSTVVSFAETPDVLNIENNDIITKVFQDKAKTLIGDQNSTNSRLIYTGTWTQYFLYTASNGNIHKSTAMGDSVTLNFYGTSIKYFAHTDYLNGEADLYLDNIRVATVNLWSAVGMDSVLLWESNEIVKGYHSFKIVQRTAKSINLDYLQINDFGILPMDEIYITNIQMNLLSNICNVELINFSGNDYPITVFVAKYSNKLLSHIENFRIIVPAQNTKFIVSIESDSFSDLADTRIFVWNNTDRITPLKIRTEL